MGKPFSSTTFKYNMPISNELITDAKFTELSASWLEIKVNSSSNEFSLRMLICATTLSRTFQ